MPVPHQTSRSKQPHQFALFASRPQGPCWRDLVPQTREEIMRLIASLLVQVRQARHSAAQEAGDE